MNIKNKKKFFRNLKYALSAQIIALLLSIIMSIIVPKILGVEEFGYWQLFIFYAGYSGFLHFGLNDGIYLREGGKSLDELDFSLIGSQFKLSIGIHLIMSVLIVFISMICIEDYNRQIVWILIGVYMPLFNATGFLGYIFQAINETRLYSISVILDKIYFICAIMFLILIKEKNFEIFIITFIVGKIICLVYCIVKAREIILSKFYVDKQVLKELKINIAIGINLMISNIAGALILGIGRIISDQKWGIEEFAKISFAILLTNLVLTFVGQISMVLFPTLKKLKSEDLKKFYIKSRKILGVILPGFLLVYVPIKWMIQMILPQYQESLQYLIFLLPVCIYDGKMNLLCNTYFKVMRKERLLMKINVCTLIVTILLSGIGVSLFNDIYVIIIIMLIVIAIRSIISEIVLSKLLKVKVGREIIIENILVILFIFITSILGEILAFCSYLSIYSIYFLKKNLKFMIRRENEGNYFSRWKWN